MQASCAHWLKGVLEIYIYNTKQRERVGLNACVRDICLCFGWYSSAHVQWGPAVEYNDVIVTLGLLCKQHVAHTPISHISLIQT